MRSAQSLERRVLINQTADSVTAQQTRVRASLTANN